MNPTALSPRMIGYRVHSHTGEPLGEIEGVRALGFRLDRLPGHTGHHGYLPAAAVAAVDHRTGEITTVAGIEPANVVDAPPPPDERPDAWHASAEWWSDLMGHYGLYDPAGSTSQPYLHSGAR